MTLRERLIEKADRFLTEHGAIHEHQVAAFVDRFLAEVIPPWSDEMPELPPPPSQTQKTVGFWRVRKPLINLLLGVAEVVWFDGFFYLHFTSKHEGPVADQTRFQIRDGKLWARSAPGDPWEIPVLGYQFAGWIEFPQEG